ncbi:MAG: hypothetical protein ACI4RO_05155, partial [Candidatus Scatosoma sp.]
DVIIFTPTAAFTAGGWCARKKSEVVLRSGKGYGKRFAIAQAVFLKQAAESGGSALRRNGRLL